MKTTSLNPDAPLYISHRPKSLLLCSPAPTILYHPHQSPNPNPNPTFLPTYYYPCYNLHSYYLQQATMATTTAISAGGGYVPPPPPCYAVSCQLTTHYPPVSRSTTLRIRELDASTGEEIASEEDEEDRRLQVVAPPAVHNRRRVTAPRNVRQPADHRAVKYAARRCRPIIGVSHKSHEIHSDEHSEFMGKTTLMIKNLPNKFRKETMLGILGDHCREENEKAKASKGVEGVLSEIDYFYLPIDFNTEINLGYCFVNFTTSVGACRLYKYLHNYEWTTAGSPKKCEVNFARIQGRAECVRNSETMTFRRPKPIPDSFLPVHFHPPFNGSNRPREFTHGVRERI